VSARRPGDEAFAEAYRRRLRRWARRGPLLAFLYGLLIIGALLGVFVARGYPPVLAVLSGLFLAGCAALGAYLGSKTLRKMGLSGVTAGRPGHRALRDILSPAAKRWARRAPLLFLLYGLVIIGTLCGFFAAIGVRPAVVAVVALIVGGWAASGAYLAKKVLRRLRL